MDSCSGSIRSSENNLEGYSVVFTPCSFTSLFRLHRESELLKIVVIPVDTVSLVLAATGYGALGLRAVVRSMRERVLKSTWTGKYYCEPFASGL